MPSNARSPGLISPSKQIFSSKLSQIFTFLKLAFKCGVGTEIIKAGEKDSPPLFIFDSISDYCILF